MEKFKGVTRNEQTLADWNQQQDELCELFVKQVVPVVCKVFDTTLEDITRMNDKPKSIHSGKLSRRHERVLPRQVLCWIVRSEGRFSVSRFERRLFGQNHATAVHSISKVNDYILCDRWFQDKMQECCSAIHEIGYSKSLLCYEDKVKDAFVCS